MKSKRLILQITLVLIFLAISSLFIALAKSTVTSYLEQMQAYTAQIYQLKDTATTPEGMEQLQSLLESISPIVRKASYITFIAVPLTLFALWTALIGTSVYLSRKAHKKYREFMIGFAAVSAIPAAASAYLIMKALQAGGISFLSGAGLGSIGVYAALLFAISYLTFIAYALVIKQPLKKIPQGLIIAVKKIHILLPLFSGLAVLALATVSITFMTFLSALSPGWSLLYNSLALLASTSAVVLLENHIIKTVTKINSP